MSNIESGVAEIIERGVIVRNPASVDIDDSVQADRIAPGVVIHAGCRIRGADTSIGPGCVIGEEAPATVDNCQLAANVQLKGGFYSGATFLDNVSFGSCAHVRPETLLEDHVSCAHSVAFKHTILMPFVVSGSQINFCDCLMAGGTGRRDHGEIGSSFVHFNYSVHRDKATASLIGDVPRGVMLNSPPVFLGGQGGIAGPVHVEFGTSTAAGIILRKNIKCQGMMVFGDPISQKGSRPYNCEIYHDIRRIVENNIAYIGNLHALLEWYRRVRTLFMTDQWRQSCIKAAAARIELMIQERVRRMAELAANARESLRATSRRVLPAITPEQRANQELFIRKWPSMQEKLASPPDEAVAESERDAFLEKATRAAEQSPGDYTGAIQGLDIADRALGTAWLDKITNGYQSLCCECC